MSQPFSNSFASVYDLIYKTKDYSAECDLLEGVFQRFAKSSPRSVLDLGCGTGGHAVVLAERGYQVTGVDRSSGMLCIAKEKAEEQSTQIRLEQADLCELTLNEEFDACISMFAVICYQLSNDRLERALQTVSHHLRSGGLFVMDFWFGPAVLHLRPETRVANYDQGEKKITRIVEPKLDPLSQTVSVQYRLLEFQNDSFIGESEETHQMRFLFPEELRYFLDKAGLELLQLFAFPDLNREPNLQTWNAMAVARKQLGAQ